RDDRWLASAETAKRIGAGVSLANHHHLNLRHVAYRGNLEALEVRVHHAAQPLIYDAPLHQREAQSLDDSTLHLAAQRQRIHDTATVVDVDDTPYAYLPGPDVYLDLGELRPKRAIGNILGVRAAHALRADLVAVELAEEIADGAEVPSGLARVDTPIAHLQ